MEESTCGSNVLPRLRLVTKMGLIGIRTVLGGQGICEARPRAVVAKLDGQQPGRFDRVARRGMEVRHKGGRVGEVIRADVWERARSWGGQGLERCNERRRGR